jgi:hypothetical protein
VTVPYPGVYGQPPQQPYAPPPQQYPPQQYPAQYPPQQGYAPQPQYPAQGYVQQPPAPPAQPLAQGSLDDYYSQPSTGGGGGLKFTGPNNQPLINQSYLFRVSRPVTNADIQQQTDKDNKPLTFRDGRPKFVMIVPAELLEPSPNHPDGLAKWYVKGGARDDLVRAMAEAGAPEGPPEMGAVIRVTLTGTRPSGPGMNPAHVFAVQYWRPEGAQSAPAAAAPAEQPAPQQQQYAPAPAAQPQLPPANYAPAPVQQQLPPQQYQQPAQYAEHAAPQGYAPQPAYAPQQAAPPQQYQQAPAQQPAQPPAATSPATGQAPAVPQPPADLTPDQQQLLARLTGQQAQTA